MNDLPAQLFENPVWHSLLTGHRHLAVRAGDACRYPATVAPFIAIGEPTAAAMHDACSLIAPGESVWLIGEEFPDTPGLAWEETLPCRQMMLPDDVAAPEISADIVRLSEADAPEMVALTTLACPGFFRERTCEMGTYYGVRRDGELIAMGGERLMIEGYAEISGLCTHPAYRGQGLAAALIGQLVRDHRRAGLVSWLHVGVENTHAIELYLRLGFVKVRQVSARRIRCAG